MTDSLAHKVSVQRFEKAQRADAYADLHGRDTEHGARYAAEARFWRDAATRAAYGDLTPVTFKAAARRKTLSDAAKHQEA